MDNRIADLVGVAYPNKGPVLISKEAGSSSVVKVVDHKALVKLLSGISEVLNHTQRHGGSSRKALRALKSSKHMRALEKYVALRGGGKYVVKRGVSGSIPGIGQLFGTRHARKIRDVSNAENLARKP